MATVVVIDEREYRKQFHGNTGMLFKYIDEIGKETRRGAAALAPKPGMPPNNMTRINYSTGRLAASIRVKTFPGYEIESYVYTKVKHALWVHESVWRGGRGPQYIYPKRGKFLKFQVKGKTVFARRVRSIWIPQPFLRRALQAAMRRGPRRVLP
jgi:hypothetical protein